MPLLLPAIGLLSARVLLLIVGSLSLRALIIALVVLATPTSAVPPIGAIILAFPALLRRSVARGLLRGLAQLENTAYRLLQPIQQGIPLLWRVRALLLLGWPLLPLIIAALLTLRAGFLRSLLSLLWLPLRARPLSLWSIVRALVVALPLAIPLAFVLIALRALLLRLVPLLLCRLLWALLAYGFLMPLRCIICGLAQVLRDGRHRRAGRRGRCGIFFFLFKIGHGWKGVRSRRLGLRGHAVASDSLWQAPSGHALVLFECGMCFMPIPA